MIHAHSVQAHVDAFGHAPGGEIKMVQIVPAQLGTQNKFLARQIAQHLSEQHFAHPAPVKRRGIDEIHAQLKRHAAGLQRLLNGHPAKFLPQRRGAVGDHRQFQICLAELTSFHG